MSWPDAVNGLLEVLGAFFVGLSIARLHVEKLVRGVSFLHIGFFTLWGLWNCFYYPSLDQWASFIGGVSLTFANCWYVTQLVYYTAKERP